MWKSNVGGMRMKKTMKWLFALLVLACLSVLSGVGYWRYLLPDDYFVEQGGRLTVSEVITAENRDTAVSAARVSSGNSYRATLKLLGVFPVKEVTVTVTNRPVVVLGGMPFGVKLYTDGVLVVSLSSVDGKGGTANPARNAGLKVGDLILSINGERVSTNEEVSKLVKSSGGKTMVFRIKRDGIESEIRFCAVKSKAENCFKAGIWVRDSSAGIGTMTFFDPRTNMVAGLGHAVCDVDTGDIVPIASGEIVPARIYGVTKSQTGIPGELRGGFRSGSYGQLMINGQSGVYAVAGNNAIGGERLEVAFKQDIKEGPAKLYTTINGTEPKWYDIRITQVRYHDENATRNMIIEITDKELLKATGGIVQGMSGSPIVQNDRLVGAVTHVFVNDPTKGYAIFAENMLETAQSVVENNRLNDAS